MTKELLAQAKAFLTEGDRWRKAPQARDTVGQNKTPQMRAFQNSFAKQMGWQGRANTCRMCNAEISPKVNPRDASAFKDSLSLREFGISGMCQACQDKTFGGPEEGVLTRAGLIEAILNEFAPDTPPTWYKREQAKKKGPLGRLLDPYSYVKT